MTEVPVRSTPLVLVPARGEADRVRRVVELVLANSEADVVLLDGGRNGLPPVEQSGRVRRLDVEPGVGSAVRAGLEHARSSGYQVIARVDGDGQHDPAVLTAMLDRICATAI